ncbi:MAG: molybdopterin-binding protein [Proteobacteria bacterium]|nr:molybdopterin-binding protein [Pseudomonadota bacterium]MBU4355038.1 molybdopterin-binding protein [Pseudomonadota bacterium]MBU4447160.1 molybdopterin-binding protein [Pseudomonadota bacterium]MCG2773926.1 molybdopterin-binding protein [Desulfobacterales bacterium]
MIKTISLEEAVGTQLAHDITEIRPGEFKGPAFRKGHTVCDEDLCRLQRLGKNHLYLIDLEADEIHENEAAALLAGALAGAGIAWENNPREGKINLCAAWDGLLQVDVQALSAFNLVDEVMCATLHNHTLVKQGELVGGTRALPLVMKRVAIQRAAAIASQNGGVVSVKPLQKTRAGLVITGNEVYHGLIQDRFAPTLTGKIEALGSEVAALEFAPDDAEAIARAIRAHLQRGCNLLLLSGGMSVDPDDVTRHGIRLAGATEMHYGAAVLPGAMFLVAYLGKVPLLGVPACALHHRSTALDLVLPRILAGEHIGKSELAFLGHGGLCRDCPECLYPNCSFGKG